MHGCLDSHKKVAGKKKNFKLRQICRVIGTKQSSYDLLQSIIFREWTPRSREGANTVDYFIDYVGGTILDLGTSLMKWHGIILACGVL